MKCTSRNIDHLQCTNSDCKESTCNVGDLGLIPGLGRSPGRRHGNPLQYFCLENPHGQRSLADYSPYGCKLVLCLVSQLCLTLCDPLDCDPPCSSVHGDSLGKNTKVGCHAFLQGIFPVQGSNPGLLALQADSLPSEPQRRPKKT